MSDRRDARRTLRVYEDEWYTWFADDKALNDPRSDIIEVDAKFARDYLAAKRRFARLTKQLKELCEQ